jgi:hypothetical protein
MSGHAVSDEDARRLLSKLNRRAGAVSLLRQRHFSWQVWLLQGVAPAAAGGWAGISGRRVDWLLVAVLLAILLPDGTVQHRSEPAP